MSTELPVSRTEQYLAGIAGDSAELPAPVTRQDSFLAKIAGMDVETPEPVSRAEQYLHEIAENGGGGGDITLENLTVTQNGTTTAPSGKAYKKVVANVQPALQSKTAAQNGTVTPDSGYDGLSQVTVDVQPVLQNKTVTENGTYTADSGYDGLGELVVNVSGGGGDLYPFWTDVYDSPLPSGVTVNGTIQAPLLSPLWVDSASQNARNFFSEECGLGTQTSANATLTVTITGDLAQMRLNQVISDRELFAGIVEYSGSIYNSSLLSTYNMVLLGDFSQGGEASGNALLDAITNYSAVALQGVYNKTPGSKFNTTMIYPPTTLVERFAGMKDRNSSRSCFVTFTDAQTAALTGTMQVIIYGIP